MVAPDTKHTSLDWHYVGVSPQLLARVRLNWSALQLDLDSVWRDSVRNLPGFSQVEHSAGLNDSRPIDLLLLFDQGICWVDSLRHVCLMLQRHGGQERRLVPEQVQALAAVTSRLRTALAAVRMLTLAGLTVPAMQISRSISEDVDLALAMLVRRKIARAFVECVSPEDAADFWRRHVAGGRAFQLVAQGLYRFGLDYSGESDYVKWRKEVLVFLGSAVHTSFVSGAAAERGAAEGGLTPSSQECLYFATIRVQEMCAYSLVLGADLRRDLADLPPPEGLPGTRLRFMRTGGEILIDQMRWLTEDRAPETSTALH